MKKEYENLLSVLRNNGMSDSDIKRVKKAWKFAKLAHTGQLRLNKDPVAYHCLRTAKNLAQWGLDSASIIAGLLHESIEEGGAKREDLVSEFGGEVTKLVDGVTKVSDVKLRASEDEVFVENLRRMFLAMARDLRVVLIKLADRLHDMQTLSVLPVEKRKRIARETLEIFAPLAERLGMGMVKAQLDDLAFPFVHPKEYKKVRKESAVHYKKAEEHIKKMKRKVLRELGKEGIRAEIHGRRKHLYSLWRKLERPGIEWDFEKVYDIVALRIIVKNISDCYIALGVVHDLFKPSPRFGVSDFIAQPKPNGYRSIHARVFGLKGGVVEIQIRTEGMHNQAEYGIAAHWVYSEVKRKAEVHDEVLEKEGVGIPDKLVWVKQLAQWQEQITGSAEFLKAVKFDALGERIFVFSPKGDVFDLPVGATPVDFAYAVHTDLAEYIKSAKVDGKIVPLDYKLTSGSVCEILKTKNPKKPNRDWLDFVVTNVARGKINRYLRGKKR